MLDICFPSPEIMVQYMKEKYHIALFLPDTREHLEYNRRVLRRNKMELYITNNMKTWVVCILRESR